MKKHIFLSFLLLCIIGITKAQVIIGDGQDGAPAILQIGANNKGLLIPRFSIPDLSASSPVTSPKTGLLAINTNATSGAGLVQWNGSEWQKIFSAQNLSDYISTLRVEKVYFVGTANGQTVATKSDVKLNMTTLVLNSGTLDDAGTTYTIPTDGLYEIAASWRSSLDAVSSYFIFKIKKNDELEAESSLSQDKNFSNMGTKKVHLGSFAAGDKITYTIFRSAGSSYTSNATISIKKID